MGTATQVSLHSRGRFAGDAAKSLGVGVQTLHYYEREGLIPPPQRSASGYRLYTPEVIERVRFIRKAQTLGLPLAEIKNILQLAERGARPCGRVQRALRQKLREVDERLQELRDFRKELAALVEHSSELRDHDTGARVCAIVEEAPPLRITDTSTARLAHSRRRTRTHLR